MKPLPLELLVVQGEGRNSRYLVRCDRVELGRLERGQVPHEGQVLFPEPTVSRLHAELRWEPQQRAYVLWHRSSTNPTLVNGKKVARCQVVKPGDRVQMGHLVLETRIGVGQHADPELDTVDVAQLVRAVRQEAGAWAPRPVRPLPPVPRPPTPLPAFKLPDPPPAPAPPRPEPVPPRPIRLVELERMEPEAEPEVEAEVEADGHLEEAAVEASAPVVVEKPRPYRRAGRKIGRNEKCPCGSGKKYKKCCLV